MQALDNGQDVAETTDWRIRARSINIDTGRWHNNMKVTARHGTVRHGVAVR
jgi:hypothetical protein